MRKALAAALIAAILTAAAVFAAAEEDPDSCFSGEWLEKDTQFTVLEVTEKTGDGWDVEITSPVSHGAWTIRATAFRDSGAYAYADGVKYDLPADGETPAKEAETGLRGTLKHGGTAEDPLLVWHDGAMHAEGETVAFERAPALPPYVSAGGDPIEAAVANALAKDVRAAEYKTEPGYVTIPCPIIHKTERTDETHATVYGSFWILNYVKRGTCLHCISGGEYPAVLTLENTDGQWRVTAAEEAGDGEDYAADIRRFANGDKKLEEQYFDGADLGSEANGALRTEIIRAYVEANGLNIDAYQDYGWDPVPLH